MLKNNFEFYFSVTSQIAEMLGVQVPHSFFAKDIFDVEAYIAKIAANDSTFEGIVVRDIFNNPIDTETLATLTAKPSSM